MTIAKFQRSHGRDVSGQGGEARPDSLFLLKTDGALTRLRGMAARRLQSI
jgi:hypothetical protein